MVNEHSKNIKVVLCGISYIILHNIIYGGKDALLYNLKQYFGCFSY